LPFGIRPLLCASPLVFHLHSRLLPPGEASSPGCAFLFFRAMPLPSFVQDMFITSNDALERRLVNGTSKELDLGSDPQLLLHTWIALYTVAQILLLILLATLLIRRRTAGSGRGWTLLNFLFTMLLNTVVFCILYYSGEQANPNPPIGLCLTQATLKHGTGPMTQAAILCLAVHVFISTRASINAQKDSPRTIRILLVVPYLMFIAGALPVLIMGLMYPVNVERVEHLYYCSLNSNIYGDISTFVGVAIILTAAVIQGRTVMTLRRSWLRVRKLRASGAIDVSLIVRISVLVGLQIVLIILTVASFVIGGIVSDWVVAVYEGLLPIFAFAVFGLRRSILEMWFPCFIPPKQSTISSDLFSSGHTAPKMGTEKRSAGAMV